ncbi:protein-glutamine gamma-glutamyltransferase [Halalkalibacillus sediminis]|uniref:Protein-glutamine gamma-glutamyltransferase n=1 Tax=Halalkalibacillus sediminis TaxID=2018042 RepID=A0A2I0QXU7_9BACI|nr:protein-glutamine gamma-glutamyltransferase [Halalkalibacillus sediminis]PKR79164.1 protein-glutamine gamma-glutamyltransferase [Halalkalibacillus sediminis]
MIQISGRPFEPGELGELDRIDNAILQRMNDSPVVYTYDSAGELYFEIRLRKSIMDSSEMMNRSRMKFATFKETRGNTNYWHVTEIGGFQLQPGVKPSDAIQDFYNNSAMYAFECAGAIIIIYYHAVLKVIGEQFFNELFPDLYIYSWHSDTDLGLTNTYTDHILPGDVVYFDNPDFDPDTPEWRGENAVTMLDGYFFGHGLGILRAEQIINRLNRLRRRGATQSAYLKDLVVKPSYKHLAKFSNLSRTYNPYKWNVVVIPHNEDSIPYDQYRFYLSHVFQS